ncbi:hypothetical protein TIFTF001_030912 [Ficus carica]|uniref:Uncharacterized protein n=1 Tax=Ficus carica TaxID=3494 RepID=A0AA88DVE9_FICCA|nr:hypothetical protein TIFTF001_030912 [Ficus carica]
MPCESSSSAQKTRTWLLKKLSSSQDSAQKSSKADVHIDQAVLTKVFLSEAELENVALARQHAPTTERKVKQFETSVLWSGATCQECTELDEATHGVVIGAEANGLGVELLDVGHQVTPLHFMAAY